MMQDRFVITILFLLIVSINSSSSTYAEQPIVDVIDETEIIFIGKLIKTYQKSEASTTGSNGAIFTTYVFSILEILKGHYLEDTITVKKLGGCDSASGRYVEYSFAGYDYKINQEALMFVNYHNNANHLSKSILKVSLISFNLLDL